jgi:glycerol-3-phosphate dehydrogenase
MRFLLPHHKALRPAWFIRLGLFFYDHLGGRKLLSGTRMVDLRNSRYGEPLLEKFRKAFEYSDCVVDDARLVVLNAMAAREKGAQIYSRCKVLAARQEQGIWAIEVQDVMSGAKRVLHAKVLINAAGPWVSDVVENVIQTESKNSKTKVRLVKGSHIIVPRLYTHNRAYTFQGADGRVVFTVPFQQDFTLIGTTDIDYDGDLNQVKISPEEVTYLCDLAGEYFERPPTPNDVVWQYAGVRPLFDDGKDLAQAATRDYILNLEGGSSGQAAILNVIGGKVTTYRVQAEDVLEKIKHFFPEMKTKWTAGQCLPGGDMADGSVVVETAKMHAQYPDLDKKYVERLVQSYGSLADRILNKNQKIELLGQCFGGDLYEAEVIYLMENEWAVTAQDILWRRSKLGLRFSESEKAALDSWMENHRKSDNYDNREFALQGVQ